MKTGEWITLREHLAHRKEGILARWTELALRDWGGGAGLQRGPDRFRNPVGGIVEDNLRALLEAWLEGASPGAMTDRLEAIIRLGAVLHPGAAQAVSFVSSFKGIIRQELQDAPPPTAGALAALEERMDALALLADDLLRKCRARIGEIRIREARRTTWVSERIAGRQPARDRS
jgi:hypothetical protein